MLPDILFSSVHFKELSISQLEPIRRSYTTLWVKLGCDCVWNVCVCVCLKINHLFLIRHVWSPACVGMQMDLQSLDPPDRLAHTSTLRGVCVCVCFLKAQIMVRLTFPPPGGRRAAKHWCASTLSWIIWTDYPAALYCTYIFKLKSFIWSV